MKVYGHLIEKGALCTRSGDGDAPTDARLFTTLKKRSHE